MSVLGPLEVSTLISNHSNILKLTWSQRGCTPEEFYNNLLLPPPQNSTSTSCCNLLEEGFGQYTVDVWLKEGSALGLLETMSLYCRWRALKVCTQTSCKALSVSLSTSIPHCSTYTGFRDWILCLAACMCSYIQLGGVFYSPKSLVDEIDYLFNTLLHNKTRYNENQRWLESVSLVEVFELVVWISRLHGQFRDPRIIPPPREYLDLTHTRTLDAIAKARAAGLCPRRVWGIVSNMPRGHLNLPTFIPMDADRLVPPHVGHDDCTVDFCQESVMSFTNVKQLHVCTVGRGRGPSCNLTSDPLPPFPDHLLNEAAMNGVPTAWTFDGTAIVEPGQPYMAISHVWADGTGNGRDEFNRCLYARFCSIAASLGCIGIWWDTICLPKGKQARAAAINNMQLYYQNAETTLVHDLYIQRYSWVESDERKEEGACFAILMSSWWTRGWTALELLMSRRVKVLFADLLIKDLDADILASSGFPSSACRLLATSAIRSLRNPVKYLDNILLILGPRYVSMPRDKGIIASILLGVEIPIHASRQQIYQNPIQKKVRVISADNLFHGKETMAHPSFSWCPVDMLDMPSTRTPDALGHLRLRIWREGQMALMGMWDVCSIDYLQKRARVAWKAVPPLIEARLREALSKEHIHEHVLLCEFIQKYPRALVVKPMICPTEPYDIIGAQWVGSIDFQWKDDSDGWASKEEDVIAEQRLGRYSVVFGSLSDMDEIGPGMAAYDYLHGLRPRETPGGGGGDQITSYERVSNGPKAWWQV